MLGPCEQWKDELVSLIYPDESKSPELLAHLQSCGSCQKEIKDLGSTLSFSHRLPDLFPPPALTEKVFQKIAKPENFFEKMKRAFLHPASVGLTVFCLTLAGSFAYQRYAGHAPSAPLALRVASSPSPSTSSEEGSLARGPLQTVAYPPSYGNYRMVGWQPALHLVADLDRPVLRHTDVGSLEQASIEAVASFKHQLAMRHILDGEYDKAHEVLHNIADNYMNYSHWEQAVLQHMRLMKKMGRQDEMRNDLARLQEYAMATPEVINQAQMEVNF